MASVLNLVTILVKYLRLLRYKMVLQTYTDLSNLVAAASDGGGNHTASRAVETGGEASLF